jgi:hypothetical protein
MQLKNVLVYIYVLGLFVLPIAGCHDDVEVIEPETASRAFEGSPDPKFAGVWKTENGVSVYNIAKGGTYQLESKIRVQGKKPFLSHLTGQWAVKGDKMLFKDQSGMVSSYRCSLEGNKLTLTTGGSLKAKTVMDR